MPTRAPLVTVQVKSQHDVVLARQRARQLAEILGFDQTARTRVATAVSELSRNAFQYAGGGVARYSIDPDHRRYVIVIEDEGEGIENLDSILAGRYRSQTGLGLGLLGARKLLPHFQVDTSEEGTRVAVGLPLPATTPPIDGEFLRRVGDEMAQPLDTLPHSEVLLQNQDLLRAHAELEAQQDKTEALNRQLSQASDAKDRFLAMLGHEMRNMLGALRHATEVLRREPEPDKRERMHDVARRQIDHMTRLVDDLLDASKIAAGKLDLHINTLDLGVEVGREVETWRPEFEAAGIEARFHCTDASTAVRADPARLSQIVGNLLSNAKKFTDPGGQVDIEVDVQDDWVRCTVTDTGCGFEPASLSHILEPFSQGSAARRRMTGGLGLGLAVVRALLEEQGGRLIGHSDGTGQGATFRFDLPCLALDEPCDEPPCAKSGDTTVGALRVLLIDDHQASVLGLAELLRFDGHEIEVAEDGPTGLDVARRFRPQAVICDLGLPQMDGFEVARRLRALEETAEASIFALSGYGDPESIEKARAAGFDDHLLKPVDFQRLERLLSAVETD